MTKYQKWMISQPNSGDILMDYITKRIHVGMVKQITIMLHKPKGEFKGTFTGIYNQITKEQIGL